MPETSESSLGLEGWGEGQDSALKSSQRCSMREKLSKCASITLKALVPCTNCTHWLTFFLTFISPSWIPIIPGPGVKLPYALCWCARARPTPCCQPLLITMPLPSQKCPSLDNMLFSHLSVEETEKS